MPRLFAIRPGSLKTVLVSVDASQSIPLILSHKGLVLLEPGKLTDEIMGNALLLNSPAKFKLVDKLDHIVTDKYELIYLVSTDPDCYVIKEDYYADNRKMSVNHIRTIVRMP